MQKYAKIIDNEAHLVIVGTGDDAEYYASIGMTLLDVEQASDGRWYEAGHAPITLKDYESAVDAHINTVAQANDFDGIQTCSKYSGFDNAFRGHAEALLAYNAACWVTCHTILDAVQAGTRTPPTIAELLAELPIFNYTEA